MKTGMILYIIGDDRRRKIDRAAVIRQMPVPVEQLEIVSKYQGHYDIDGAWWTLTARGMHRVICNIARINRSGDIQLTGRAFRLCG